MLKNIIKTIYYNDTQEIDCRARHTRLQNLVSHGAHEIHRAVVVKAGSDRQRPMMNQAVVKRPVPDARYTASGRLDAGAA